MDSKQPATAHFAKSKTEAAIIKGLLEQEGIPARIFDGSDAAGIFDVVETEPQVLVDQGDLEQAKEVIAGFQEELKKKPDMANVSDAEGQFDWPMCPVCDEMRLATCDQCQTESSEFSNDGEHVVCLACNKQATISYADHCKFCDHDFTGTTPDNVAVSDTALEATNTHRVLLLVGGLLLLFIVLGIWFATTFQ